MSEGTHSKTLKESLLQKKVVILLAGTVGAVLIGAVAMQFLRAGDSNADVRVSGDDSSQTGNASVGNSGRSKKYVAKVGNELIHYDTVAGECVQRYGQEILDKIINRTIIAQACEKRGVVVSAEEVEQEIVRIAKKFNLDKQNWFAMLQAERNITPMQYRRDVIWPMLALKKLAGTDIDVTQQDIQRAFVRDYGPRVEAKMIMFGKLRHAEEVWKTASENPSEFGRLARLHSIEPNSRALSGSIPPIRRYSGAPELERAAFELKPGEVSGIVQVGPSQYVILLCEGHTEPTVKDISEVQEILHEQILEEKVQSSVAKVFGEIKDETKVINYLTGETTGGIKPASGTSTPR